MSRPIAIDIGGPLGVVLLAAAVAVWLIPRALKKADEVIDGAESARQDTALGIADWWAEVTGLAGHERRLLADPAYAAQYSVFGSVDW